MSQNNVTMSAVQTIAVNKALMMLKAAGCQFKVIAPDGSEYGELKLAAPEPEKVVKRRPPTYAYGALKAYYWPLIKDMKVGEVVCVPPGQYDLRKLRSAVSADVAGSWGKGAAITSIVGGDNPHIEILRVE